MIRLKIRNKLAHKTVKRLKSKARVRKKVDGTAERPRLNVYRSARHIYAQIIDDISGKTLASASSVADEAKGKKTEAAKQVGAAVAKKALAQNIKEVVFDRSGFVYHGRVKAVAEGAREAGLKF